MITPQNCQFSSNRKSKPGYVSPRQKCGMKDIILCELVCLHFKSQYSSGPQPVLTKNTELENILRMRLLKHSGRTKGISWLWRVL